MRTFEEFVAAASEAGLRLNASAKEIKPGAPMTADALFHLPLLALCIQIAAFRSKGKFETTDLSTWTSALLAHTFPALRQSSQRLEWSFNLRRRCADALFFLEAAKFVSVLREPPRKISITDRGRDFLAVAMRDEGELGTLVRGLSRSYSVIKAQGFTLLWE